MNASSIAAVERGAALLDRERPGWYEEIDLERLLIASTTDCALGQLFEANSEWPEIDKYLLVGEPTCHANYNYGLWVLGLEDDESSRHGFDRGYCVVHDTVDLCYDGESGCEQSSTYASLDEAWVAAIKVRQEAASAASLALPVTGDAVPAPVPVDGVLV